jgi:hypothetical protein
MCLLSLFRQIWDEPPEPEGLPSDWDLDADWYTGRRKWPRSHRLRAALYAEDEERRGKGR